jgi:hypothetical protein
MKEIIKDNAWHGFDDTNKKPPFIQRHFPAIGITVCLIVIVVILWGFPIADYENEQADAHQVNHIKTVCKDMPSVMLMFAEAEADGVITNGEFDDILNKTKVILDVINDGYEARVEELGNEIEIMENRNEELHNEIDLLTYPVEP